MRFSFKESKLTSLKSLNFYYSVLNHIVWLEGARPPWVLHSKDPEVTIYKTSCANYQFLAEKNSDQNHLHCLLRHSFLWMAIQTSPVSHAWPPWHLATLPPLHLPTTSYQSPTFPSCVDHIPGIAGSSLSWLTWVTLVRTSILQNHHLEYVCDGVRDGLYLED